MKQTRKSNYKILPEILNRWSPRAMSGRSVSKSELFTLFEAARYAPSARNYQPWRFVYSTHRSAMWADFVSTLEESQQEWCKNAGALILLAVEKCDDHLHWLDAGAAWENLAIQGYSMGLVIHPIAMFDHEKMRGVLKIGDNYEIILLIAVGRPGDVNELSVEYRDREFPSGRKKLSEIVSKEKFIWK